jgi:hypothetical protein
MIRLQVVYQGSANQNSLAEAMKEHFVAVLPAQKIMNRSSTAPHQAGDRAKTPIHSRNNPEVGDETRRKGPNARMSGAQRADVGIPSGR